MGVEIYMKLRNFKKLSLLLALSSLAACNKTESNNPNVLGPIQSGSYTSECFHNKQASTSIGSNIYTIATMTFSANGKGTNHFALYTDAACSTPALAEGTLSLSLTYVTNYGDTFVALMKQSDGGEEQAYYLTGVVDGADIILDLDFTKNPSCGPYELQPSEGDTLFFSADPAARGVLMRSS